MAPPSVATAPEAGVWEPENPAFWKATGSRLGNRALWVTTYCLFFSFATWFMWSAIIVRLPGIAGFEWLGANPNLQFWLAAMPGLAGATLRIPFSFIVQKFGTRKVVSICTALLLVPAFAAGWIVQHPVDQSGYYLMLFLAFLAGMGGGNFAAFMSSTSLFFPKAKQGTALGIQAGIGNFGVSATQFLIPVVIGAGVLGVLAGDPQVFTKVAPDGTKAVSEIFLQNAGFMYLLPVLIGAIAGAIFLRDVPGPKRSVSEQLVIFRRKHNWTMTSLYFMTFGTFAGMSATFPLMIKNLFGGLPNAPDPLAYAFIGPLIGSVVRPVGGWLADKVGGAILTTFSGIVLLAGSLLVTMFTHPTSAADFTPFLYVMLGIFFAAGVGNGSTFRQIPIIFPPKEAAPVLGWTSAIAAYGSFIFPVMFGWALVTLTNVNVAFYILAVFYVINIGINWYYYNRPGAEIKC